MNARADIDLVLPCYNPPSGWEERVATHFREVERLFSPVRFHLFIVSDGSRRGYEPETINRMSASWTISPAGEKDMPCERR